MDDHFTVLNDHLRYTRSNGQTTFKNKAYKREYWTQRGIEQSYDWLIDVTSFLPPGTSISVRFYFAERGLTSIPLCPTCGKPITIPKTYGECLPTTHNTCTRAHIDHKIQTTNLIRYGGNPMGNANVRSKHADAIETIDRTDVVTKILTTKKLRNPSHGECANRKRTAASTAKLRKQHDYECGIDFPQQRHMSADTISKLKDANWLASEYLTKPANQIARELGVNKTIIQNRLHKFNIPTIKRYSSDQENQVAEFCTNLGLVVERNVRLDGLDFELDIWIPEKRIAIEYHGLYWHVEQNQPRKNIHHYKYRKCSEQGIQLIQIWSNEWLHNNSCVVHRLTHILGATHRTVYARKCTVADVSASVATKFLTNYHIQGAVGATIRLGLYDGTDLVALMTFGKSRFSKDYEWELLRFCSSCSVVGGASRLLAHFIKIMKPTSIVSYSNNRYGTGKMYTQIGMKHAHETKADYYYVRLKDTSKVYHRSSFQKHKLRALLSTYDPNKTEYQNMLDNGYDRIWDCGNKAFVWSIAINNPILD